MSRRPRRSRRGARGARAQQSVHTVEVAEAPAETRATAYRLGPNVCEVVPIPLDGVKDLRTPGTVLWIDAQGTANAPFFHALGKVYDLHPLAVEDALHLHQRAKVETYPSHGFLVARMVYFDVHVCHEQISMFIGKDFVITAQEDPFNGDPFDEFRRQLQRGTRRPAITTPDLLAHALLDTIVDAYFPVLDAFGAALENLEDEVLATRNNSILGRIQIARRDVIMLRRALWPLRDALFMLGRDGFSFSAEARLYLRDTTDHLLRIIDLAEGYRETVSSLMDLYLSSMSNRMNETMRVLAVISTIFIPLTFIAGVYGMNFDTKASDLNMPELASPIGYPVVLGAMGVIAISLVVFFYRRGWFQGVGGQPPEARADTPEPNSAPGAEVRSPPRDE